MLPQRSAGVIKGIGDEVAVLIPLAGISLPPPSNLQVEGVHFMGGVIAPTSWGAG